MTDLSHAIEAYHVQHVPIIKAYADQLGLVGLIYHDVRTEMEVDAGTIVLGLVVDTLSSRSPLYRLEEFFGDQDTALLLGKALSPQAFHDDHLGRVLDRLYDFGTIATVAYPDQFHACRYTDHCWYPARLRKTSIIH
jgi:hypothetical protein